MTKSGVTRQGNRRTVTTWAGRLCLTVESRGLKVQHFSFLIIGTYGAAMIGLYALAFLTPKDDGSRVYRRQTIVMCGTGVMFLGNVAYKMENWMELFYVVWPSILFGLIGVQLFFGGRRSSLMPSPE